MKLFGNNNNNNKSRKAAATTLNFKCAKCWNHGKFVTALAIPSKNTRRGKLYHHDKYSYFISRNAASERKHVTVLLLSKSL